MGKPFVYYPGNPALRDDKDWVVFAGYAKDKKGRLTGEELYRPRGRAADELGCRGAYSFAFAVELARTLEARLPPAPPAKGGRPAAVRRLGGNGNPLP